MAGCRRKGLRPPDTCRTAVQILEMQMTELKHHRLALDTGIEMDAYTVGDRAKPALIFLHGFPESHRTWRHQLPHYSFIVV